MTKKVITRRKLLKNTAKATLGAAILMNAPFELLGGTTGKTTRIILVRDKNLIDDAGNYNAEIMQKMIDQAVLKLTGETDIKIAWKKIIKPEDIVGIKTNVWNYLPTPAELEQSIKKRVMEAGVPESRIGIKDRGLLRDDIFLKATALINTRPMRTHAWSGVGSLIKNYIMFSPRPPSYHDDSCADLAKLWDLPLVKGKTRLNVLVMGTPLFHGAGPHHFNKQYTWPYQGIIVGFDPVACDAVGLKILQEKRKEYFGEDKPLNPPAKHILLADTRHQLGTADMNKIDLIKTGWDDGSTFV
ncbi:MAG: DUF362 domain-containing protein [Bacteroidales bacterium]|nr:DUF362 domain-containing protein [Bacteroidales bacterium]